MVIAFLGAHKYAPYILRKKRPPELEDEPSEEWLEEPPEWAVVLADWTRADGSGGSGEAR
jgi:hypothetical protein